MFFLLLWLNYPQIKLIYPGCLLNSKNRYTEGLGGLKNIHKACGLCVVGFPTLDGPATHLASFEDTYYLAFRNGILSPKRIKYMSQDGALIIGKMRHITHLNWIHKLVYCTCEERKIILPLTFEVLGLRHPVTKRQINRKKLIRSLITCISSVHMEIPRETE